MRDVIGCAALVGLTVVVIALLVGLMTLVSPAFCDGRWGDHPHRWSLASGCVVQDADGNWIPEKNYIVIEQPL